MNFPSDLKYTESHEWLKVEGNEGIIGLSDFAQNELGDIVYVELPEVGTEFKKGESFGTVEAVKAASDIYMPVSGKIIAINQELEEYPELVNSSPYENGWIIKIELTNPEEANELKSADEYEQLVNNG